MTTTKGEIKLRLFEKESPLAVASFLHLTSQNFYNGIIFHRVIKNFMIQTGDPLGKGSGGPQNKRITSFPFKGQNMIYPFVDEFESGKMFDRPGILAMANAGPDTNGSQFFITHVPTPWLNNKHTIFGEVLGPEDLKVVNAIQQGDKIVSIKIL
jgi:peptidyl-prolyl cis-trans isomerase B (cyclophilin B)